MAVGDPIRANVFAVDLGKYRVATYQNVAGLRIGSQTVEVKSVTATGVMLNRKIPGDPERPDVTLTRPMDSSRTWLEWVMMTARNQDVDPARANVTITLLDSAKKPAVRFNLKNAWASIWEAPELQAGNTAPAIEKITLVYEDITVDTK
ncbi:phage tail protein [Nocardia brasiliensis]|uniref:phage tail protein n=1 Tax=Nocardia brasiliensis TaxID=37326 RepID=UPI002455AFDA|nr:phage tail protein [Nocardia brasiliensis]